MFQYIKMLIISIISGVMAPLPASSAAHTAFLNAVMGFTDNERMLSFYCSVFGLAFAFVVFFTLRKIYIKTFKSAFSKGSESSKSAEAYKKLAKNLFLSVLPLAFLYIPVSGDGTLLIDYFDKFLVSSGFILMAFSSFISTFVVVISIWYTKQKNAPTKRTAATKDVLRMSVYQLVSYVVPGMSKVSLGAVNMLICDIDPKVIMREVYVYLAPQLLVVSTVNIIRGIVANIVIDPIMIAVAFFGFVLASAVIIHFVSKVNMRKLLGFFAAYSAIFGIFAGVASFLV